MRAHNRKFGGKSIRHHRINWNMPHLFRNDGVHLNDLGNDIPLVGVSQFKFESIQKTQNGPKIYPPKNWPKKLNSMVGNVF